MHRALDDLFLIAILEMIKTCIFQKLHLNFLRKDFNMPASGPMALELGMALLTTTPGSLACKKILAEISSESRSLHIIIC